MNVVIRADASVLIGTGHIFRCLTLARCLRSRGATVRFITRAHAGHLIELLSAEMVPVTVLPPPEGGGPAGDDAYAGWRGVPEAQDAMETIAALAGECPDWLVVDHYGLSAAWEKALRPHASRIMAIDDLPARAHECDLLLNQNAGAASGPLPAGCLTLLGPRYALLRPEYAEWCRMVSPHTGTVGRVVVFFGGVDAENLTGDTLQVLREPELSHLEVDVVVGGNNPHRSALELLATDRPRTRVHSGRPHLADLLAGAQLAIGAGGGATWERLCLGVPSLLVGVSENQLTACHALAESGLAVYLGPLAAWQPSVLRSALQRVLAEPEQLRAMSSGARELVDGLGTARVVEQLWPTAFGQLTVRADRPREFVLEAGHLPLARVTFAPAGGQEEVSFSILEALPPAPLKQRLLVGALNQLRSARPRGFDAGGWKSLAPLRLRAANRSDALRLAILSDAASWLNDDLASLVLGWLEEGHTVEWVHRPADLSGGDLCFFIGCGQIVPAAVRARYRHNLVVHESALPHGKGWSPLTWQVLEGRSEISVTLLEAAERVDSGDIYAQQTITLTGSELVGELREQQARATLNLCQDFVRGFPEAARVAQPQAGMESFYPRRRPVDSRLDPKLSLEAQFNRLRVADNERYPAYFERAGKVYHVKISTP